MRHNYPDYTEYRYKHQEMLSKVKALREDYKQGKMDVSDSLRTGLTNISQERINNTAGLTV